jgi:hypothetical protein
MRAGRLSLSRSWAPLTHVSEGQNVTELRHQTSQTHQFDFELLVTSITLAGPPGIRAREYWQSPSMARWTINASDPGEAAGATVTFQIDDSQKQHFQVGQRIRLTLEPT